MTEPEVPPISEPHSPGFIPPKIPLATKILIGVLIGAALGITANILTANNTPAREQLDGWVVNLIEPIGKVFLRLVFMVVLPLVFSALALGVVAIGDVRRLGTLGLRTLAFTLIFSVTAVALGVGLVNLLQPGSVLTAEQRDALRSKYADTATSTMDKAAKAKPLRDILLDIIPENPIQEMVGALDGTSKGNGMLAVMFFSLVFGIALVGIGPERGQVMVQWLEGLFDITMAIINFAMRLAPVGVACLLFSITSRVGVDILWTLVWFVITVLLGLGLQLLVTYPLMIRIFSGMGPIRFFRSVREAMITAFGTSSSNATLPTALRVAEEELKIPPSTARFVLTVGATGNQNGTALYEGVVVLFLAQVFGVELTMFQQVSVVLMSVLAGVGTAGVPGGSLPLIVVVLRSVGVPGEGIGIILGVDRVLDMCRTVLNVTGDLAVATCVAGKDMKEDKAMAETEVAV